MYTEKQKEYARKWYHENKAKRKASNKASAARVRAWFVEYRKALKCSRCPESDPVCLEFHHRNPADKDLAVSIMASHGYGRKRILKEISKCEVLCANCHRKLHWAFSSSGRAQPLQG